MRSARLLVILGLAAVLPLAAVPPLAAAAVRLVVPPPLAGTWARITAAHPLPPALGAGGGEADAAVALEASAGASPGAPGAWKAVERRWLAPVGLLGAPAPDPGPPLPLESIRLPMVAFPVDGLYPGDPGYPLVEDVLLVVDSDDPVLLEWFQSVPAVGGAPLEKPVSWIAAVGDVMPARGVDGLLAAQGGLERVFGDTLPLLAGADLVLGNLEGAATRRGEKASKSFTFRFDPAVLGSLARAGFSYLSLTNNHTFDYGEQGFIDTLAALRAAGIATSGAGRDEAQAWKSADLRAGDTPVRILSFGAYPVDRTGFDGRQTARAGAAKPGILWLDEKSAARAAALFSPWVLDVVMVHGGEEWTRGPTGRQRELFGRLLHAGADVVIGSHSHVLQPVEALGGGLVAWSLGNFLFPGMEGTPGGEDSAILRLGVFAGAVRYVHLVPVRLKGTTVRRGPADR